jgi:hypothetical protein
MNSEIVKPGIMVLTGRENADVLDADVVVGWKCCKLLLKRCWSRGREKVDVA